MIAIDIAAALASAFASPRTHSRRFARLSVLAGIALACIALTGRSAQSQNAAPPSAAHSPFGVITGVVVDSLHGHALAGAQVSVEGLNDPAMTDSAGHFTIDSVPPGQYRIGVFHPLLDSLGLSIATPPLRVIADSALGVILATPSAPTLIRLVCGPIQIDTLAGFGPSVVIGHVLDAENDAPAAGVRVTLSWTDLEESANRGLRRIQRVRDTTTGPDGGFRFCKLPPDVNGVARATVSTADSSVVSRPLVIGDRLVVALVLHVPGTGTATTPSGSHGTESSAGSVLTGRVTHPDGSGSLAGAQVMVIGSRVTAVTDDSGKFTLRGLPAGSRTLAVRAVGWQPVLMPVDLAVREPRQVVVPLGIRTATLQTVVVTATLDAGLKRVGFDARKHSGTGRFMTPEDVEKRGAFDIVDLLDNTPGVMRRPGPDGEDYLAGTRGVSGCVQYIVDGVPYAELTRGDINTYVRAREVGAVEVYQASEGAGRMAFSSDVVIMQVGRGSQRAGAMDGNAARNSGIGRGTGTGGGTGCVKIVIWTKAMLGLR